MNDQSNGQAWPSVVGAVEQFKTENPETLLIEEVVVLRVPSGWLVSWAGHGAAFVPLPKPQAIVSVPSLWTTVDPGSDFYGVTTKTPPDYIKWNIIDEETP